MHANIIATGSYVPEIKVTNDDLRARFNATNPDFVDKMEASTGIFTRWWAPDDVVTSDLAVRASRIALARSGVGVRASPMRVSALLQTM